MTIFIGEYLISKNLKEKTYSLVEKKFTEQLRKNSFTNIFLKDYYVANFDSSKLLLKYLENQDFYNLLKIENYFIKDGMLITNITINQNNEKLANMLLFKDLKMININGKAIVLKDGESIDRRHEIFEKLVDLNTFIDKLYKD